MKTAVIGDVPCSMALCRRTGCVSALGIGWQRGGIQVGL
jgi:hypothetical protein